MGRGDGLIPAELAEIRARGFSAGVIVWGDAHRLIVALEQIQQHVPGRGPIADRVAALAERMREQARERERALARAGQRAKRTADESGLFEA